MTSPVSDTVWNGKQSVVIAWKDDGTAPSLATFGPANILIDVDDALEQVTMKSFFFFKKKRDS